MDLLWICGKSFGAQVHGSEKWQANCDLLTFYKLNIDNHGIPQTTQYISFWVAGTSKLCST